MTKYARDEFDRVPEASTRQGVHRTVAAPGARRLGPILASGGAALAVGLVAFLLLPETGLWSGRRLGHVRGPGQQQRRGVAGSFLRRRLKAVPQQPADRQPRPGGLHAVPLRHAERRRGPGRGQKIDKTQPVAVYNGTTTAGLAGRVGSKAHRRRMGPGPGRQLGRRAPADLGGLLQRPGAEGERRSAGLAPRNWHPGGFGGLPDAAGRRPGPRFPVAPGRPTASVTPE